VSITLLADVTSITVAPNQAGTTLASPSRARSKKSRSEMEAHSSRPFIGSNVANKYPRSITSFAAVFKALPRF